MPESFVDIIKWWPTTRMMAENLGVPHGKVRAWKFHDTIPAQYWGLLLETGLAKRNRLTASRLTKLADMRYR